MSELTRGHATPTFHNCKGEKSKYKFSCPISLDSTGTGMCAAFAVAHALASSPNNLKVTRQTAYLINDEARFFKKTGKATDNLEACVQAAVAIGYASDYGQITSFEEYKEAIADSPVLLGLTMFEGMYAPDRFGFLGVWNKREPIGNHAMVAFGRDPRWFNGRLSWLKNSGGSNWGNHGECKISDRDLKWLWKHDHVRAYQVFVAKG